MNTSGEMVKSASCQACNIEGLQEGNFSLPDGQAFLLKNEGNETSILKLRPPEWTTGPSLKQDFIRVGTRKL